MWGMNRKSLQKNEWGKYFCTVHDSLVPNYHRVQLRPRIKVQRNTQLRDPLWWKSLYLPHGPGKTKVLSVLGYLQPSVKHLFLATRSISWQGSAVQLFWRCCSVTPVTALGFILPVLSCLWKPTLQTRLLQRRCRQAVPCKKQQYFSFSIWVPFFKLTSVLLLLVFNFEYREVH